jgi:hypothetical protein
MMTKQREAITTTLQPSMHTRLHGVLHFAAPSCLGSQEEIILLPKKTRLCASRPQQPLSSPQKKKKTEKTQSRTKKIQNFQFPITNTAIWKCKSPSQIARNCKQIQKSSQQKTILLLRQTQKR